MVERFNGLPHGEIHCFNGLMIQRFSGFMVPWISIWAKTCKNHWLNGFLVQWFNGFPSAQQPLAKWFD